MNIQKIPTFLSFLYGIRALLAISKKTQRLHLLLLYFILCALHQMATNTDSSAISSTPVVITPGNVITANSSTIIAINASLMPIKLTPENYAAWRAQFLNLLYGYDLVGFVDGTTPCPS